MNLQEFQQLSFEEKIELTKGAVSIAKRETILHTGVLYRLENFYVEVLWRKPQHFIYQVNGFDDPQCLSRYGELKNHH